MYVAITRARERLYLTRSRSRYLYGHRDLTRPSRFIGELASELGVQPPMHTSYAYVGAGKGYSSYSGGYGGAGTGKALYSSAEGYESDLQKRGSSFKPSFGAQTPPKGGAKNYSVGTRVRHPKFGMGMVIAVKNGGSVINVAFDGQGIKELSASIAPLEII